MKVRERKGNDDDDVIEQYSCLSPSPSLPTYLHSYIINIYIYIDTRERRGKGEGGLDVDDFMMVLRRVCVSVCYVNYNIYINKEGMRKKKICRASVCVCVCFYLS